MREAIRKCVNDIRDAMARGAVYKVNPVDGEHRVVDVEISLEGQLRVKIQGLRNWLTVTSADRIEQWR